MTSKKKVIVILGQTATGKSDLAVKIAKKFKGEIISADSRQVYSGLDIGTGKISKKGMKGIPHHLLDVASPKKKFTVTQYQKLAISAIAKIIKKGKTPIICGGTGFYIDAITNGVVFPEVPPNKKLRNILDKKSVQELFAILKKIDQRRAKTVDKNNKVRLVRAIEIAKALGKVPLLKTTESPYQFVKVGLQISQNELRKKVESRVKDMFRMGLLNEIRKLKKAGISNRRFQELGFEYFNPSYESVVSGTIKYTKRQATWFKRDKTIKWCTPKEINKIEKYIKSRL